MKNSPDMSLWTGRTDDEGATALRWHQQVRPWQADSAPGVALLGFACDAGVRRNHGRAGAASGPLAIRQALSGQPALRHRPLTPAMSSVSMTNLSSRKPNCRVKLHSCLRAGIFRWSWGRARSRLRQLPGTGHDVLGTGLGAAHRHHQLGRAPGYAFESASLVGDAVCSDFPPLQWPFLYFCAGVSETANTAALLDNARALGVEMVFDEQMHPGICARRRSGCKRLSTSVIASI